MVSGPLVAGNPKPEARDRSQIGADLVSRATPAAKCAAWCALAIVGQAATLNLIDAGPRLHYQHFRPLAEAIERHVLALAFLGCQAFCVFFAFAVSRRRTIGWIRQYFSLPQLFVIGSLFLLTPAILSRDIGRYVEELAVMAVVQTIQLGNAILIGTSVPRRLTEWIRERSSYLTNAAMTSRIVLGAAVCTTLITGALAFFIYERHPHLQDEVAYILHARLLARGMLEAPTPPVADAFSLYLIETEQSRSYPVTLPGWPAILALGVAAGLPWMVNPLLAGISVYVVYRLVWELYDNVTGMSVALLFSLSPWQLFLSMSFMTHALSLLLGAVGVAVAIRNVKRKGHVYFVLSGLLAGFAVTVRPLDGLLVTSCLGMIALFAGGVRSRMKRLLLLCAGFAVPLFALLAYNHQITGSATLLPMQSYTDKHFGKGSNDIGFGPNRGFGWALDPFPGHGPLDAIVNSHLNISSINFDLLGWSTGSLLAISLFVLRRRLTIVDFGVLGFTAAVIGAHSLYYFSGGPDFGARYWYLLFPALLMLTVRGLQALCEYLGDCWKDNAIVVVVVLSISAIMTVLPWRAFDKYKGYLGMTPDARSLVSSGIITGRSLVLVRGSRFPDYASAAAYNPLDYRENVPLFAFESDPAISIRLLDAYPDRSLWVYQDRSSGAHTGRLIGPLSPDEFAKSLGR